jgi:hypothetical protein
MEFRLEDLTNSKTLLLEVSVCWGEGRD